MSNLINLFEDQHGADAMEPEDILESFTCMLCIGIAINPLKCDTCEQVYCKNCIPENFFDARIKTNIYGDTYPKKYACYKMCGSEKLVLLTKIEKSILNSLPFTCQHADEHKCTAVVKYGDMKAHLEKECVHKIEFEEEKETLEQSFKLKAER